MKLWIGDVVCARASVVTLLVLVGVFAAAFEAPKATAQPYDVIFIRPGGAVEPDWVLVKREDNIYSSQETSVTRN